MGELMLGKYSNDYSPHSYIYLPFEFYPLYISALRLCYVFVKHTYDRRKIKCGANAPPLDLQILDNSNKEKSYSVVLLS